MKRVLLVGGLDPSGCSGLAADIRTAAAMGAHGLPVVAAVAAQSSKRVIAVWPMPDAALLDQVGALLADVGIDAIKTGALATAEVVENVADLLGGLDVPFVVDPVCRSSSSGDLLTPAGRAALCGRLASRAIVVTPNRDEATLLTGKKQADAAIAALHAHGAQWVLLTGGDVAGDDVVDLLSDGTSVTELRAPRINAAGTRGSGCTLATAIAVRVAEGDAVPAAVEAARMFVRRAIEDSYPLDAGTGPVRQVTPGRSFRP